MSGEPPAAPPPPRTATPQAAHPRDTPPRPMSPTEAAEFRRRQRGRNIALLVVLVALAAVFYAISIVKLAHA